MRLTVPKIHKIAEAFADCKTLEYDDIRCVTRQAGAPGKYDEVAFTYHHIIQVFKPKTAKWYYVMQHDFRGTVSFVDMSRASKVPTISPFGYGLAKLVNTVCVALGDVPRVQYLDPNRMADMQGAELPKCGKLSHLLYGSVSFMALQLTRHHQG